jgi:hypothetical protein
MYPMQATFDARTSEFVWGQSSFHSPHISSIKRQDVDGTTEVTLSYILYSTIHSFIYYPSLHPYRNLPSLLGPRDQMMGVTENRPQCIAQDLK